MKSVPHSFYSSKAWTDCRRHYLELHPICERCLAKGLFNPATHVHHKTYLNAENYKRPEVALNMDNLEALCLACHNEEHFGGDKVPRRYFIDEHGTLRVL